MTLQSDSVASNAAGRLGSSEGKGGWRRDLRDSALLLQSAHYDAGHNDLAKTEANHLTTDYASKHEAS